MTFSVKSDPTLKAVLWDLDRPWKNCWSAALSLNVRPALSTACRSLTFQTTRRWFGAGGFESWSLNLECRAA